MSGDAPTRVRHARVSPAQRLAGLRNNTLLRRAAMVASGAAAGQLILAAASPILSRWFDPEAFGLLGAFLGVATLLGTCGAFRLELAIQAADTDDEADDVAVLALRTAFVVALLAAVVIIALAVGRGSTDSMLWLVPPTALAITAFNTGVFRSIRAGHFTSVARARLLLGIGTVVPQLLAGALGAGAFGLLIGPLIGWGAAALILLGRAGVQPTRSLTESGATLLKRHRRFPLFSVWSGLFNRGALEVPAVLLLAFFDQRAAGLFYLCNRVLVVPANVVADGLYQSFLNQAGELARTDAAGLHRRTRNLVGSLAIAVVVPVGIGMLVVPPLLPVVFGAAWEDAGPLALRLLPMVATLVIAVPVSSQLWLLGRQDLELLRDAGRFVAVVAVFVTANAADWTLTRTVTAYSIVMGLAYLTTAGLALWVTARHRVPTAPAVDEAAARTGEVPSRG